MGSLLNVFRGLLRRSCSRAGVASMAVGLVSLAATAAEPFDLAVWIDHFDEHHHIDTESVEGITRIIDHAVDMGATTVVWRPFAGGLIRHHTELEDGHYPVRIDKRKSSDARKPYGEVRYGHVKHDILQTVVDLCRARGLRILVHYEWGDCHWVLATVTRFALEHPQYCERRQDGFEYIGHLSIAYPEVQEYKLALLKEMLERGIDGVVFDLWRQGGYGPIYGYTPKVVEEYRRAHGTAPPADARNVDWLMFRAKYMTQFMRKVRTLLDSQSRPLELVAALPYIGKDPLDTLRVNVVYWPAFVEENLLDGFLAMSIMWDTDRPFESAAEIMQSVSDTIAGRCRIYWPLQVGGYSTQQGKRGLPDLMKHTGLELDACVEKWFELAWGAGASGFQLECMDFAATPPELRTITRRLMQGKYIRTR